MQTIFNRGNFTLWDTHPSKSRNVITLLKNKHELYIVDNELPVPMQLNFDISAEPQKG